ncbi:hypothetical protein [Longirhabdus pacifica]|uniref:hypothetical protein n=1 Tax=Longirhabdus pacifica TaxID=2305227 RepID=UPI001008A566|nr:hypothetical protein [Longirhabdus pacifica]
MMKKHLTVFLAVFLFLSSVSITFAIPEVPPNGDVRYVNVTKTFSKSYYSSCASIPSKIAHAEKYKGKWYKGELNKLGYTCTSSGNVWSVNYKGFIVSS